MGSSASKSSAANNKTNNSGGDKKEPSPSASQTPHSDNKLAKTETNKVTSKTDDAHTKPAPKADTSSPEKSDQTAATDKLKSTSEHKAGASDKSEMKPVNETQAGNKTEQSSTPQPKQAAVVKAESKETKKEEKKKSDAADQAAEKLIDEGPKDQKMFDAAIKSACLLVKPESVLKHATKSVSKLQLSRSLPLHFSLPTLLNKLENLKDLDLSNNKLGPQGFRAVCLAMCSNSTILSLNLADNMSDTDSADSLGKMLEKNQTLQYLDISSNYLGKDYFCQKCGPHLKTNTSLQTLRCASIGTTDARQLLDALRENTALTELDFSNNYVADPVSFAKALADNLKRQDCVLTSLSLGRCDIKSAAVKELQHGICGNKSLCELNLKGCEFDSLGVMVEFVVKAGQNPSLLTLCVDSCKLKSTDAKSDVPPMDSASPLQVLSFNDCGLTDAFFTSLEKCCKGRLLSLVEIDLAANVELSAACIDCLANITSEDEQGSSLRRIIFCEQSKGDNFTEKLREKNLPGLDTIDKNNCIMSPDYVKPDAKQGSSLPPIQPSQPKKGGNFTDKLLEKKLPAVQYVNLRNCKLSPESVGQLGQYLSTAGSCLSTVILDGQKLSKTGAVAALLGSSKSSQLSTLSISSSSLDDDDLSPLFQAIKTGLQLHMLKLSANRITDVGIQTFVEALLSNKKHPLAVVDFSNNRIGDKGADLFCKLFTTKSHNSTLHSLNLSANQIGKEGLLHLMSAVGGKSPLQLLYVHGQSQSLDEPHMVEIYTKLAASLGFKVQMDGEAIKSGCSDLSPALLSGLMIKLTNLGGQTGNIGQALDSVSLQTDYIEDRCPTLSLNHVMQVCCFLKGLKTERCVWSEEDWNMIIGADKATTDTPSWLKLAEERDKCIYLSNLPGNTTQQKIDAMLEMEADCNLNETVLMKDPVTRSINGAGWGVMVDQESVQKALDYFNQGEARVFGQPIMISEVKVQVDNSASADQEQKAMEDRDTRMKQRAKEDAAHRSLITRTAEESWKRHAYRLAHPAYADGRIW